MGLYRYLGPGINTPGKMFSLFIHDDGLYTSLPTGHLGMGGLDIFKAEKNRDDPNGLTLPI